ncbi:MAG: nucleotidyltransferase family protein [Candidatus Tectomicrobia bacterium]|uniref:Nucleotidyltransferase family protein n=1 Tax=Tectimicrobiota bacterium TaxID=2528274 RepID=A0A932GRD2_UNCTE|nr:nucleotidyltransferase family protein [Candidatus Tectomicrobia bacterium]
MGFDAIILAGDSAGSRKVKGENKALLEIQGVPLIAHVLMALQEASGVDAIYVVGPQNRIEKALGKSQILPKATKLRRIFNQKRTLYRNVWTGIRGVLGVQHPNALPANSPVRDQAVLIVPGDTPLLIPEEIDEFLSKCSLESYDYFVGLTREEYLEPYYPRSGVPGIQMAYFAFREGYFRINNLHLVKPLRIRNRYFIAKVYQYRYQKHLLNILYSAWELLRLPSSLRALRAYTLMQLSRVLMRMSLNRLSFYTRRLVSLRSLEEYAGKFLGTRLTSVETSFGGAALDVDNEQDFQVISQMFTRWRQFQLSLGEKRRLEKAGGRTGGDVAVGVA